VSRASFSSWLVTAPVLGAAAACAAWALWPLRPPPELTWDSMTDAPQGEGAGQVTETVVLDTTAFAAPLWIAPPPPPPKPAPPAPPPPPPPLRLQLVGIVVEEGGPRAVLYDPDTDVLHIVASGEAVGSCVVESVSKAEVTLRQGDRLRTLALRDAGQEGAIR